MFVGSMAASNWHFTDLVEFGFSVGALLPRGVIERFRPPVPACLLELVQKVVGPAVNCLPLHSKRYQMGFKK